MLAPSGGWKAAVEKDGQRRALVSTTTPTTPTRLTGDLALGRLAIGELLGELLEERLHLGGSFGQGVRPNGGKELPRDACCERKLDLLELSLEVLLLVLAGGAEPLVCWEPVLSCGRLN